MRQTIKCLAIVFLSIGLAGVAFGDERILLAKAQVGEQLGMSSWVDGAEICFDKEVNESPKHKRMGFAAAELNDTDLGKIRGRAMTSTTLDIPSFSASAIILWDEPGAKGGERVNRSNIGNLGAGLNISTISIQGR